MFWVKGMYFKIYEFDDWKVKGFWIVLIIF